MSMLIDQSRSLRAEIDHLGKAGLDADRLRLLVSYDPETGEFRRIVRAGARPAGSLAGTRTKRGYVQIGACGAFHLAHRLAWLWTHGEWPASDIDHLNGDKSDNRIANLRAVTKSENMQNFRAARKDSTSGLLGTSPSKGKWQAKIQVDGKTRHLGTFSTAEDAHRAYVSAKRDLHSGCTL